MFKVGDKVITNRGGDDNTLVTGVICSIEGDRIFIAQNEEIGGVPKEPRGLDFMVRNNFKYSWCVTMSDPYGYIKLTEDGLKDWFKQNVCLKREI